MPTARARAKRITIFNHKGGVGKTTLTMNVAAALAELGRRVLIVDSDPQCNITSYLIEDSVVDDLLDNSDGPNGATVWSAVKPVSEGSGAFKVVKPIERGVDNLYLIPGDIRLAEFERDLAEFWSQALERRVRGFNGSTALSEAVNQAALGIDADYILYDPGPNIGPLNRAILLDCDHFIVPVACDLFSLRALKTLGRTLVAWMTGWSTILNLAPEGTYVLPGRPAFLGYVPEGFRVYAGEVAKAPAQYLTRIEREVHAQIVAVIRGFDPTLASGRLQSKLGEVKNLSGLVPSSHEEGVPLWKVSAGTTGQRREAERAFQSLAKRIDARVHPE